MSNFTSPKLLRTPQSLCAAGFHKLVARCETDIADILYILHIYSKILFIQYNANMFCPDPCNCNQATLRQTSKEVFARAGKDNAPWAAVGSLAMFWVYGPLASHPFFCGSISPLWLKPPWLT